jgi:DnaJ-domain-containing protein 1
MAAGSPSTAPSTDRPKNRTIEDWPALLRRCAELDITAQHLGIAEESLEVALASIISANRPPAWKLEQRNKLKKQLQREIANAETAAVLAGPAALEQPTELLVAAVLAASDPHASLGLEPAASADAVRKRYHGLLLRLHPDKCDHAQAKQATLAVEEAYRTLVQGDI